MTEVVHPASQYKEPYSEDEPIRPALETGDLVVACPPLEHNYVHGVINHGPYKKFTMILIYCTKCGEVRFKEVI